MKTLNRLSRFLGNEKARAKMLSGVIAAVMMLSAVTGFFLMSQNASAATEDLTTYTEVDAGNHLTINATTAVLYADRSWTAYAYKDYGVDYFGNFTIHFNAKCDLDQDSHWEAAIMLSNNVGDLYDHINSGNKVISVDFHDLTEPNENQIQLRYFNGTDSVLDSWNGVVANQVYYFNLSRSGTTLTLKIYNDSGMSDLASTLTLTDDGTNYRYLYATATYNNGATPRYANLTVSDIELIEESSNTPPTVSITAPTEGATVNGTVSIQGTASDSDGTVQSVQVKIDSGSWQNATGTTSWSYSWDSTGVSDGSHTIYARSFDGTDYSTETSVGVTVDNVADTDPSVALSGLTGGKITWAGTAPGSYWCNATGAGNETLNIAITGGSGANDTDITQINITIPGDLTNGSNTIDPSAISLYVSVDNSTFHDMGAFPTNGGTIVLNTTTWTWTDDPFPIAGNDNIYCRFKITYADGATSGVYSVTGVTVSILG